MTARTTQASAGVWLDAGDHLLYRPLHFRARRGTHLQALRITLPALKIAGGILLS